MPSSLYYVFRAHVREQLVARGMSQAELAEKLGVDPSYVSQILNGHRRPGLRSLEAFAKAFEMDPADLITKTS